MRKYLWASQREPQMTYRNETETLLELMENVDFHGARISK